MRRPCENCGDVKILRHSGAHIGWCKRCSNHAHTTNWNKRNPKKKRGIDATYRKKKTTKDWLSRFARLSEEFKDE